MEGMLGTAIRSLKDQPPLAKFEPSTREASRMDNYQTFSKESDSIESMK
jgi:hypothetical protein